MPWRAVQWPCHLRRRAGPNVALNGSTAQRLKGHGKGSRTHARDPAPRSAPRRIRNQCARCRPGGPALYRRTSASSDAQFRRSVSRPAPGSERRDTATDARNTARTSRGRSAVPAPSFVAILIRKSSSHTRDAGLGSPSRKFDSAPSPSPASAHRQALKAGRVRISSQSLAPRRLAYRSVPELLYSSIGSRHRVS
jgi:hypothetical protein